MKITNKYKIDGTFNKQKGVYDYTIQLNVKVKSMSLLHDRVNTLKKVNSIIDELLKENLSIVQIDDTKNAINKVEDFEYCNGCLNIKDSCICFQQPKASIDNEEE